MATSALDDDRTTLSLKLWDVPSGSILWQETDSREESPPRPSPPFSVDGNHVIYH